MARPVQAEDIITAYFDGLIKQRFPAEVRTPQQLPLPGACTHYDEP